jgi:hypothetical protein
MADTHWVTRSVISRAVVRWCAERARRDTAMRETRESEDPKPSRSTLWPAGGARNPKSSCPCSMRSRCVRCRSIAPSFSRTIVTATMSTCPCVTSQTAPGSISGSGSFALVAIGVPSVRKRSRMDSDIVVTRP